MASAYVIVVTALLSLSTEPPLPVAAVVQDTAAPLEDEIDQIYRRENFVYPRDNRRNPFMSLLEVEDAGPQFEDLDLVGIIFGGSVGSVATLIDRASGKRYRVRRGETTGNARVVEIRPDAVVFRVSQFGVTHSETLRIKKEEEERG